MKFSGIAHDPSGTPHSGVVGITFALYREQQGGAPLWLETQNVELDAEGRYSVLLGAEHEQGLPWELFSSGEARWLGVHILGEPEQPRVLLVSVPYALKAADAERLGGKPASAYVLTELQGRSTVVTSAPLLTGGAGGTQAVVDGSGTTNSLAKFTSSTTIGDSGAFDSGGNIGFGLTNPAVRLHVKGSSFGETALVVERDDGGSNVSAFRIHPFGSVSNGRARIVFSMGNSLADATPVMTLARDGKVGIGTVAPGQTLDVVGTVKATAFVGDGSGLTNLPSGAGGDITAVNTAAGSGLTGGAASGDANLSLLTSCSSGQVLKWGGSSWACATDNTGGGGTVTSITAGSGLTGGTITSSGTIAANFAGPGAATTVARSDHTHALAGTGNIGVGAGALASNVSGTLNTAVGTSALTSNTGSKNTALGASALLDNTTGGENTAVGSGALESNISGFFNTAVGSNALGANLTGGGNTAVGTNALSLNTAGDNTALGGSALEGNTSGQFNTALGTAALRANQTGASNTAVGGNALLLNTGSFNTAAGELALRANTSGDFNTALGSRALAQHSTGSDNTALGFSALGGQNTGSNNIALGSGAGFNLASGNGNIYIGSVGPPSLGSESDTIRIGMFQTATFIAGTVTAAAFVGDGSGLTGVPSSAGGDITEVNTGVGSGLTGGATSGAVNLSLLTSCSSGQVLKWGGTSWACAADDSGAGGSGDITAVNTAVGSGLTGGVTSGDANISLLTSCASGEILKWNGASWACAADSGGGGGGTVTSVGSGTGLTGGPITTSGTLSIDASVVPRLSVANTFTNNQSITGNLSVSGSLGAGSGNITGNLGMGVASPTLRLHLKGSSFEETAFVVERDDGGSNVSAFRIHPFGSVSNGRARIVFSMGNSLADATPVMTLARDGKVGIGTVAPVQMLDVVGTVKATAFVGDGSGLTGVPSSAGGDITAVNTGASSGLTGGAASGDVSLSLLTSCASGQVLKWGGSSWACAADTDTNSGGTVTSVASGDGLTGGPITASGALSVNSTVARRNAANTFTANQTITGNLSVSGIGGFTGNSSDAVLQVTQSGSGNSLSVNSASNLAAAVSGSANASSGAGVGLWGSASTGSGTGVRGSNFSNTGFTTGVEGSVSSPNGTGVRGENTAASGSTVGVFGRVNSASGTAGVFDNVGNGNILIGRVNGVNKFRVDQTGKGFFNGNTQVGGADFAESVEVSGHNSEYQPGDVLVIDSTGNRRVALAQQPYSTQVAGIYSTKPGVLATTHEMDDPRLLEEIPMAIVGIVPCKVSAENGPIERGDLLVTSSVPGHAMKGTDRARMLGAIVGKALEPLPSGTGIVEVLVTLQ